MKLLTSLLLYVGLFLIIIIGAPVVLSAKPTHLQMSCAGAGTATFSWTGVSGVNDYILRISNEPAGDWFNGAAGDQWVCVQGTSATRAIIPGSPYEKWSVEPSNAGCTSRTSQVSAPRFRCDSTSFNCTAPGVRCIECDACGYCLGKPAPGNWEKCSACIYPGASSDPTYNNTLAVDPDPGVNKPYRQPAKGKYFTQLGCIDTNLSSFQDARAAGGVLNFILSKVIFPITGILAFMSIIYGAFLLATSQDDQLQIQRGRRFIYGGIVGAIFTFSVVLIINTIGTDILKIPGFSR
ncbi:MAG: hypothetical protein O3B87_01455 [bacterium]|nr:hypothetical protein [bacterium]